jgi:hypothetical protein
MKGLVNLSQKILNCWASRTAKMSGLGPRQHFRHRAEDRKGELLCSCAMIAAPDDLHRGMTLVRRKMDLPRGCAES